MNTQQKKMYKVLSPIDKKGGGTYWLRIGSAFTNKDDSINLYLDAMPAPKDKSYHIQIRELTEEDLRKRETFSSSNANTNNNAGYGGGGPGGFASGSNGYGRDLGGIGGGPSTRAVTAASSSSEDVPF